VIDLDGAMIGVITFDRRDAERPGPVRPDSGEAWLGYLLLPEAWGRGYAVEACAAALCWFADALPGEPVVLCTQTANDHAIRLAAKLGFTEVERFEAYGAEQWSSVRSSITLSGRSLGRLTWRNAGVSVTLAGQPAVPLRIRRGRAGVDFPKSNQLFYPRPEP
jgi:RimJ/RimL family protein N-acetyltransferase